MSARTIATELGLGIGQVFKLTEDDWKFKAPAGKSRANLIGLAIDLHIKSYLAEQGITVPEDRFAEYDFMYKDVYFDIKSFSKSSVSISDRELKFAYDRLHDDKGFVYAVFEQVDDEFFSFRGYIDLRVLVEKNKLHESQYSGVYFSLNDSAVSRELFE